MFKRCGRRFWFVGFKVLLCKLQQVGLRAAQHGGRAGVTLICARRLPHASVAVEVADLFALLEGL
jgi:hypothetical protein